MYDTLLPVLTKTNWKKANVVIFKTDLTYSDLINTLAVTDIQTLIDVACIYAEQVACTVGRPSVCLSACPIDRQQQRRPAGLLLSALWAC